MLEEREGETCLIQGSLQPAGQVSCIGLATVPNWQSHSLPNQSNHPNHPSLIQLAFRRFLVLTFYGTSFERSANHEAFVNHLQLSRIDSLRRVSAS